MANPTAVSKPAVFTQQGNQGALRDFWIKIPDLSAAADCDSSSQIYYTLNPKYMDLVIVEAIANITTLDAQDGDIDIGLADDADGTNKGVEICDSLVNSATGALSLLATEEITGASRPIWKASGTSTDSYISIWQNGDADVSALVWHLFLRVIPLADMD